MSLTLLNEDLDNSETGVDISPSVTNQTRPDYILVNDEIMATDGGTSSLTVVRGAYGTTPATHSNTTPVYEVVSITSRADSLLVYYYGDDGAQAAKRIVIAADTSESLPLAVGASEGDMIKIGSQENYELATPAINIFDAADAAAGIRDAGAGGLLYAVEGHITEANAHTYTLTYPVLAGQRLFDILWYTDTAFSAATSATLKAGVTGTLNGFMTAIDCKAQGAGNSHSGAGTLWGTSNEGMITGKAGYHFAADTNLVITVITVGAGTTGRFRAVAILSSVTDVQEATVT